MISNQISAFLIARNETVSDFARNTGISYTTCFDLYHGKSKGITFDLLNKLCEYFGKSPSQLFPFVRDEIRMAKTYRGIYIDDDTNQVLISTSKDTSILEPSSFAQVRSPIGFFWGFRGAGPVALAHSLLSNEFGEDIADEFFYQFMQEVIAKLPIKGATEVAWELTSQEIESWLNNKRLLKETKAFIEEKKLLGAGVSIQEPTVIKTNNQKVGW